MARGKAMPANHPTLAQALRCQKTDAIAFVGAGGKTTAMFHCARQLAPSLVTTTTHIFEEQKNLADRHIVLSPGEDAGMCLDGLGADEVLLVTGPLNGQSQRLTAPTEEQMAELFKLSKQRNVPMFVEADGARTRTIKAPGAHEPAIPPFASKVVVTAGLSAISKPLNEETTHRPEIFAGLSGLSVGGLVTAKALAEVLVHPQGGLKNIPAQAGRVLLLTQASDHQSRAAAASIATIAGGAFGSVVVANLHPAPVVLAVHCPVAGVILAAGGSTRLGRPKVLEDYFGEPFVRRVAETALAAGLSPLVVVAGQHYPEVSAALAGLPLKVVHNSEWKEGQSTSVRAGVASLPKGTSAAVFMMADQPQLRPELLLALVEEHSKRLMPILVTMVGGKRGNPVLFDQVAFDDLLALTGDAGGRQVFHKFQVEYLEWLDGMMALDVDTEEDLALLRRLEAERRSG